MNQEERTKVVEAYSNMVWRLALAYTAHVPDAEDVFQEVFYRYFRHENSFESEEHRKAWLIRCTINRAKSVLTAPWKKRTLPLEVAEQVGVEDDCREVYAAVLALPQKYRIVIHSYYYEGLPVDTIASYLHCPVGTIKSQLSRGRELLRNSLVLEE